MYDMDTANRKALECAVRDRHFKAKVTDIDAWYKALNDASVKGTWDDLIDLIVQAMGEIDRLSKLVGNAQMDNLKKALTSAAAASEAHQVKAANNAQV